MRLRARCGGEDVMRVCFHLRVRVEKLEEYKRIHRAVWPEMLAALQRAGIWGYSIYLWRDGHEFGVLECDDWGEVRRKLAGEEVVGRWEAFMAGYLETPVGVEGPELLEEVFRME